MYSKILVPLDGPTLSETILVAMSTHSKSGIERWAIGSVTERVVRHSSDPVLVIRP